MDEIHDGHEADQYAHNARNVLLLERGLGAQRVRLADGWCGWRWGGEGGIEPRTLRCFAGHPRFNEAQAWITHYSGPDFFSALAGSFDLGHARMDRGYGHAYVEQLVTRGCPQWERLSEMEEVVAFWFSLAHATPAERAAAAEVALGL